MQIWNRLTLLAVVLLCGLIQAHAVTITFEPAPITGGSSGIFEWIEAGYRFSTPTGMSHTYYGATRLPGNGTTFLQSAYRNQPLLIRSVDGMSFTLVSVQMAEYSDVFPVPQEITFIGTRIDGSIVAQTFTLDGLVGGAENSWQTFTFPETFRNLVKVEVPTERYSLDNVVINPETLPVPNQRPAITLIKDHSIAGPGSTALFASVSDDGLPAGRSLTVEWSKVSGPGPVSFSASTKVGTLAQFALPGVYIVRCTANDGALSISDEVFIEVGNAPSAGSLITFDTLQPNTSTKEWIEQGMIFSLSPRGLAPNYPGVYSQNPQNGTPNFHPHINVGAHVSFRHIDGKKFNLYGIDLAEGDIPFGEPELITLIGTREDGSQVKKTVATDGVCDGAGPLIDFETFTFGTEWENLTRVEIESFGYAFDNVRIAAVPDPVINLPPMVEAGEQLSLSTLVLPLKVSIEPQSMSDDGLPVGSRLGITWSAVSGPAEVKFSDPSGASIQAEFSQAGAYVLRCSVSDGELSASDDRTVVIQYDNLAPTIEVISNAEIELPEKLALHATVTDPTIPEGSALTQNWKKVNGPGDVTFSAPSAVDTEATFSQPGVYVLSITATDGALSTTKEVRVIATRRPKEGRYRGLLSLNGQPSGVLQAKVRSSGAFSGVLNIGNRTIRFNSELGLDGSWKGNLKSGPLTFAVSIQFNQTTGRLTVSVEKGEAKHSATLVQMGLPKSGVPNGQFGGQHTFLLTGRSSSAQGNTSGYGFGVITARKSGAVVIAGRTPNGAAFSVGGLLSPEGAVDLFVPIPKRKAFLGGNVRFENDPEELTDVSGSMTWVVRENEQQTASFQLIGSRFQQYPSYRDPWTGSTKGVVAEFSAGGEGRTTATQSITIQPNGGIMVNAPGNMELSLKIQPTGFFYGRFRTFDTGTYTSYMGVVLQRTKRAGGRFVQAQSPGSVELNLADETTASGN